MRNILTSDEINEFDLVILRVRVRVESRDVRVETPCAMRLKYMSFQEQKV